MSSFNGNISFNVFGESHGKTMGIVIDNLPSGVKLDMSAIRKDMIRRAPTKNNWSTKRNETDEVEILSGVFDGVTTGAPLCGVIHNNDTKSRDYSKLKDTPRPGHSDFSAYIKYAGHNDYTGGGHFSARLTAPIVFAGAIARQILSEKGIEVFAHVSNIGGVADIPYDAVNPQKHDVDQKVFPVIDDKRGKEMQDIILSASKNKNSVGGSVECAICGLPAGLGGPFFSGLEGKLSSAMFAVPAVKAVEFGAGKDFENMFGSESNDGYEYIDGKVKTITNNCGGILGGISNGMPIILKTTFKPTPSIASKQKSVNLQTKENCDLEISGRHDACVVPRGLVVVEAMCLLMVLDEMININM